MDNSLMSSTLLGDYNFEQKNLDIFANSAKNKDLDSFFQSIIQTILSINEPVFLLPALLHVFSKFEKEPVSFSLFEFWMNQFSLLSLEEQLAVRGKISGKLIPRDAYQLFFPVGMDKYHPGTHFVCAHLSPDLDTTVASFIGWLDAFSAKVGLGQHLWSLPGGPSEPSIVQLFEKLWGKDLFKFIARPTPTLTLSAMDLTTREGMQEVTGDISIIAIDKGLHEKAILFVNEEGKFLGDWHSRDAEVVRPVIFLFKALLRKFENLFYIRILRFFADPGANLEKCIDVYNKTFLMHLIDSEKDYLDDDKKNLNLFLENILGIKEGLNATFADLGNAFHVMGYSRLNDFNNLIKNLIDNPLFDSGGMLKEDRTLIFQMIENLIHHLNQAISECNQFAELLSTAVSLKFQLNNHISYALTVSSTIEEIRTKMEDQDYLPVLSGDEERRPIGIIPRNALNRSPLGTVSLRDFSNFDEVHMASYLNVISVIDHHKSALRTQAPPLILVGDVQSCNTLVAEQLFIMNDKYRRQIHPTREISEYFSCLYAIIDDTDFLSKVSARDIDCVVSLLNSLKTLIHQKPCIDLSDIPRNHKFIQSSARRILKSPDMFSIYDKIIESRQTISEDALQHIATYGFDFLCSDTKDQNGCARIGQSKLFPVNFPLFEKKKALFSAVWCKKAKQIYQAQNDIALHLQMISTIPSSKDLFSGVAENYTHLDELWIWIPEDSSHAEALLATFLNSLLDSPNIREKVIKIEVHDEETGGLERIFKHNFLPLPIETVHGKKEKIAVIYVKAGTLNSRKSMVSPFLPRKVS